MQSTSSLSINWFKPDLDSEQWEFFSHPAKQEFYQTHAITWDDISCSFEQGKLVPYPRSPQLDNSTVELSYSSYEEYSRYLAKAKRGYRRNYSVMEEKLQQQGRLNLPAAIVLRTGESSLLFSGYRRLSLAWNYGMTPYIWLVELSGAAPC